MSNGCDPRPERRPDEDVGVVLAAVVILVGCGTEERHRPEKPAAATRAAESDFLRRCAHEATSATVAVLCPTRLPIGGFERPRSYGDALCSYLLNLEPRGFRKRAGTVFHLLFGGTCRPWDLQTRDGRWPARLTAARPGEDLRLIGATTLLPGQAEADRKRVALRVRGAAHAERPACDRLRLVRAAGLWLRSVAGLRRCAQR